MTIQSKFRLTNKQIAVLSTVLFSYFVCLSCDKDNRHEQVPVKKLEKIFEIEGFESTSGPQLFWNISSICCDQTDNLIVADSGWNKIFKFNPYGEHIDTVGQLGQGPGEFMANLHSAPLKISYGNNEKLYVYDQGNERFSIFSKSFLFEKSFNAPRSRKIRILDTPLVNSDGDIYLVTYEGGYLIQCFDESFAHKDGFFESNRHFHSEFFNIRPAAEKRLVGEFDLKKAISQDDHLVIISNYTLSVSIYDREHSLIREFSLKQNRDFFQDFKKRASLLKRKSATATILPFSLYLDSLGNICLGYFKGANNYVIYRYLQSGQHMDTLVASDDLFPPFVSDGKGFIYALKKDRSTLIKYRIGGNYE